MTALCLTAGGAGKRPPEMTAEDPSAVLDRMALAAFDTETTGFGASVNRIIEIGIITFRAGEAIERREWLVHPGRPVPFRIQEITGITDDMLKDRPGFCEVLPEFRTAAGDAVLIAHNAHFDVSFMQAEIARCGTEPLGLKVVDSLRIFRACFPDAPSHSIGKLVEHLGLDAGRFHRAADDAAYIIALLAEARKKPGNDALILHEIQHASLEL